MREQILTPARAALGHAALGQRRFQARFQFRAQHGLEVGMARITQLRDEPQDTGMAHAGALGEAGQWLQTDDRIVAQQQTRRLAFSRGQAIEFAVDLLGDGDPIGVGGRRGLGSRLCHGRTIPPMLNIIIHACYRKPVSVQNNTVIVQPLSGRPCPTALRLPVSMAV
jgi:hypothetical protein